MSLQTVILAGGLGTRLGSLTKKIPKALLRISGKPFIVRQLEYLCSQDIKDVIICTGFLSHLIEEEIAQLDLPINIKIRNDGKDLRGTGGAINSCLDILDDHFFITWGDTYLPINLSEIEDIFFSQRKQCLMTLLRNENKWDKSNVIFKSGLVKRYDKKNNYKDMKYIDYGISIFSKSIFEERKLPDNFDLGDLVSSLALKGEISGQEVNKRFYEIGSFAGLNETEEYFSMLDALRSKIKKKNNIFLDRDGIINEVVFRAGVVGSPREFSEFVYREEIFKFISNLEGKKIFVVTNQPDISRGLMSLSELERMNSEIKEKLKIDEVIFCPHDDKDSCLCRKPKPGMIEGLINKNNLNRDECILIGDSQKDIGAAKGSNIDSILLKTYYNETYENYSFTESLLDLI